MLGHEMLQSNLIVASFCEIFKVIDCFIFKPLLLVQVITRPLFLR